MKAKIATNHFQSKNHALVYYKRLGFNLEDVNNKIISGEIAIGPPEIKGEETVSLIDGRYWIES